MWRLPSARRLHLWGKWSFCFRLFLWLGWHEAVCWLGSQNLQEGKQMIKYLQFKLFILTFLQPPGTKVTTSNTFWLVYDPSKFPWVYFFNYFHFKWCCSIIKPVSHTRCPHQWCPCRCPPLHPCGHDASVWRWSPGCRCWTASVPFSDCWRILARQVHQCLSALAWNMITHYKQCAC